MTNEANVPVVVNKKNWVCRENTQHSTVNYYLKILGAHMKHPKLSW